jgi:PPK2 family polyphosphate:nucleotide phosphotransferase
MERGAIMDLKTDKYRVTENSKISLIDIDTEYKGKLDKAQGIDELAKIMERLVTLQELLYADSKKALLVVLQAMDGAGKDSTIRNVFGPLNPQGCSVASFKAPTSEELGHDFLWRIHKQAPLKGSIMIFNRSQYEDVLIGKVKKLASEKVIENRYDEINAFEKLLVSEGTRILKFYLNITKDYQKKRLRKRLDDPAKQWKFNPDDLTERARWDEYMKAYEIVFDRCSTDEAPWYIVPAETKWFRNLLIARIVCDTLESMDLAYPELSYDPKSIAIE